MAYDSLNSNTDRVSSNDCHGITLHVIFSFRLSSLNVSKWDPRIIDEFNIMLLPVSITRILDMLKSLEPKGITTISAFKGKTQTLFIKQSERSESNDVGKRPVISQT